MRSVGGARLGAVAAISFENAAIDIKKRQDSVGLHPAAVFTHTYIDPKVKRRGRDSNLFITRAKLRFRQLSGSPAALAGCGKSRLCS